MERNNWSKRGSRVVRAIESRTCGKKTVRLKRSGFP